MNREQAKQLVRDTFPHAFQRDQFRRFVKELVNRYDESKERTWGARQCILDAFKEHINRYERVGTYSAPDGEKLDILIVYLTKESKLERARTALRNFVAHHLKSRNDKDAGLVAFVSPTEQTWRFSFVRMEYETELTDAGVAKAKLNLTSARRFSYLVGKSESCHTAQSRFLELLQETGANPTLEQIAESFSVETVTKEFFNRYYKLFHGLKEAIEKIAAQDKTVRDEFRNKGVNAADFAKKLLGQIVFLYFIQKKGWLGVQKGQEWGTGPRDFLRRLARGEYGKCKNMFNDLFEPLFYDTLATDRGADAWCATFKTRIPFLNGGLFEPIAGYDWRSIDLTLSNDLFFNDEGTSDGDTGTGVLDVFDRYNFTVNEAEPLEQEVAIDPEMLGKVFENLLEAESRKSLGTFYTPREIVHYMCQESLINYLYRALNSGSQPIVPPKSVQGKLFGVATPVQVVLGTPGIDEKVPRDDLAALVHLGDQAAHYEAALKVGTTSYQKKARPRLPKSIEDHAKEIDNALRDIAVCDPAIGSGAFPVGMMTEIVRARLALNPYFKAADERTAYHYKRHAIHSCIYGVDIDRGAVEIAKLRLWLSLVVDEEDPLEIRPLPNLDFKIVVGNSLFGFPFQSQGLAELEKLKTQYFDEPDHDRKIAIKEHIDRRITLSLAQSQKSLGYRVDFDYRLFFSEVFRSNDGFDVVIANPPYVGFQGFMEQKEVLVSLFKTARGKFDYYIPFIEKGLECLRSDGVLCLICPTNFMKRSYGKALRQLLVDHASIAQVRDFEDQQIFEGALNYTGIFLFQKTEPPVDHSVSFKRRSLDSKELLVPQRLLTGAPWVFQDSLSRDLIHKIRSRQVSPLADISQGISEGIVTGQNEVFLLSNNKIAELGLEAELIRPCIRGRQIRRFSIGEVTESVIYPYRIEGERTTAISEEELKRHKRLWQYLTESKPKLDGRGYFEKSTKQWYELWCQRDMAQLSARKIIVAELAETSRFCVVGEDYVYGDTVCGITLRNKVKEDLRFILGVLNSTLIDYVFKTTTVPKANGFFIYKTMFLKQLPVIRIDFSVDKQRAAHDAVVEIVKLAMAVSKDGGSTECLEGEMDRIVYELYELGENEIDMIERAVKPRFSV